MFFSGLQAQELDSVIIKSQVAEAINDLREFVAIPNDALNRDDIEDNIFWIKKQFEERGFNTATLETKIYPCFLLLCQWMTRSQLFYCICI